MVVNVTPDGAMGMTWVSEVVGHHGGIFFWFLLAVGSYKEWVCTDISSHYGLLEPDSI